MAKKKKKYAYHVRKFLNRKGHHSIAFILAKVDNHPFEVLAKQDYDAWCDAEITLGDCSRSITLNFDFDDTEADQDNAIFKIETLIREFGIFKEALLGQIKNHREAKKVRKERLKAKKAAEKAKKAAANAVIKKTNPAPAG